MAKSAKSRPKFRRRAEARPDEVLDAALDLFIEKGFAATRVEDIARAAGVSKGTVYLYFSSKEVILEELVRRALVPIAENAGQLLDDFDGDPRDLMRMFAMTIAGRLQDPKVLAIPKIVIREVGNFPQLADMYRREVIGRALPFLTRVVERGIAQGIFRPVDPELTVRNIVGPLILHLLMADVFGIQPSHGADLEGFLNHHFDILFNGLNASGSDGDE